MFRIISGYSNCEVGSSAVFMLYISLMLMSAQTHMVFTYFQMEGNELLRAATCHLHVRRVSLSEMFQPSRVVA